MVKIPISKNSFQKPFQAQSHQYSSSSQERSIDILMENQFLKDSLVEYLSPSQEISKDMNSTQNKDESVIS